MRCDKGHEFSRRVNSLSSKKYKGCPICSGKTIIKINSFGNKYPNLVKIFDTDKNNNLDIFKIGPTSMIKIWWTCPKDKMHSHSRAAVNKAKQPGCPYCLGYYPDPSRTFKTIYPDLVKYWDFKKNNKIIGKEGEKITPENIHFGSHYKIFFNCPNCKKSHNSRHVRDIVKLYKKYKIKIINCNNCFTANAKAVKCNEDKREFITISEAAKFYQITNTSINYNLRGKSKYASAKQKITFSYLN